MKSVGDLFSPATSVDYGPVDALMKSPAPADADVDAFVASLDQAYGPGVAAIVTTDPPPSSFQVGSDATSICGAVNALVANALALPHEFPGQPLPANPSSLAAFQCTDDLSAIQAARGWVWAPLDALADLEQGALSGSRVAAGQTNGALVAPLAFEGDVAEGSALFAFGPTLAGARQALATVTAQPFSARQAAAEQAAHDALGGAALPSADLGPRVQAVAQRALVNVYVARDRKAGAIVASISHQPPYYLDWPRDGAFISAALDVAGLGPWVTTRQKWYAGLQRTTPAPADPLLTPLAPTDPDTGKQEFPAFAWEMNYFASGDPGGAIRFEIDNTALHVWALVTHAASLSGADRDAFVAAVWPSATKALDLLARWRDDKTGLPAPANEDDHTQLTSTLHGAVTVYAALRSGARLAHATGRDADAKRWLDRADELEQAILSNYYDAGTGLFRIARGDAPVAGAPETGWAAWPARVLEPGDPRLEKVLDADMDAVLRGLRGETEGGTYVGKNVVAAALYGKDGGSRDKAREAVTLLANVATPDTLQFGEVWVTEKAPGGGVTFSNRVAPPHVWEGVLFYLSAMALSDTSKLDLDVKQFPLPCFENCSPPAAAPQGGCGCRAAGERGGPAAPLTLVGLAAAALARRARRRGVA
jgi:MYXO-CTERM domain-containing protein